MVDIPIEDLYDKTGSVFKLVILASKRTLELTNGSPPRVEISKSIKPSIIALHEIAAGKVKFTLDG